MIKRERWSVKRKRMLIVIAFIAPMVAVTGCSGDRELPEKKADSDTMVRTEGDVRSGEESSQWETQNIVAACQDIYEEAAETGTLGSHEITERIVQRLGEKGYVAVDSENQVDMENGERALMFCRAAEAGENAELTVIAVTGFGSFQKYELRAEAGSLTVIREYVQPGRDGGIRSVSAVEYPASFWRYTQEGYLLIEGSYCSEEEFVLTLEDTTEHTALRILPLDERCREWNRKYILPLGYGQNNLFLTDWNSEEFGKLDFYDMFERLYPIFYGEPFPYNSAQNAGTKTLYQIPASEFETVILTYFSLNPETLRSHTEYVPENDAYEYRPRGFDEAEYPEIPRPEVVDCVENQDGTLTLTVNAVYPYENTSRLFSHQVVIRPADEGRFRYVSNRMLPQENEPELWWHTERAEQKAEEAASAVDFLPQAESCLFTEEEKRELENDVLAAAEQIKGVYQREAALENLSGGKLTREQCRQAVALLGGAGYVSVTKDTNMENHGRVETFYASCQEGREAMVTIFDIDREGLMRATTFLQRGDELQSFYVEAGWRQDGTPEIRSTVVSDLAEIRLTRKGYLIYSFEDVIAHSSLCQYWRVSPLSERCREYTARYVSGLSYVNYNVLVTDWDSGNVEEILMPCMFEDIYRIATGKNLRPENGRIPAEEYERIMTTYFPVNAQQLRRKCGYDEGSDSYPYEMIFAAPYPPFGEVVDYTEDADGTITLTVDGVWIDRGSDCAFTNTLVVEPFPDGTFRYLSNRIEQKELELPVVSP